MTSDGTEPTADALRRVKDALDVLILACAEAEIAAKERGCDGLVKAMHAMRGAELGFRDDVGWAVQY
jgi:hypothetical protein